MEEEEEEQEVEEEEDIGSEAGIRREREVR